MDAPPLPTADEAADLNQRVIEMIAENQGRVRRLFRRWLIVASFVLGIGVGYTSLQAHDIRASQIHNTKVSNTRAHCDEVSNHDIAHDIQVLVNATPGTTRAQIEAELKIPSTKC